ncbi:hypothetical protein NOC27_409 [Nitrosococcus oceani AFC27]|nr:hypothetical protein NOC27_409 [Nitrosococcus oceani AFC27]
MIRWHHPEHGFNSAVRVYSPAEETGLIAFHWRLDITRSLYPNAVLAAAGIRTFPILL